MSHIPPVNPQQTIHKKHRHGDNTSKTNTVMRIMALVLSPPRPPPLIFELAAAAARKGGLIAGLDIGGLKG